MSVTPFARRLPTSWNPTSGWKFFKWWPWPLGVFGDDDLFYPTDSVHPLPPQDVIEWLSVAEWRFQIEISNDSGNTAQSIDELIKPGSFYTDLVGMGSPETQGRPRNTLAEIMAIGYDYRTTDPRKDAFCGIDLSWEETIGMTTHNYSAEILLQFPRPHVNTSSDTGWSMVPEVNLTYADGVVDLSANYVNFLGDDFGSIGSLSDIFTTVAVTVGSTL